MKEIRVLCHSTKVWQIKIVGTFFFLLLSLLSQSLDK